MTRFHYWSQIKENEPPMCEIEPPSFRLTAEPTSQLRQRFAFHDLVIDFNRKVLFDRGN